MRELVGVIWTYLTVGVVGYENSKQHVPPGLCETSWYLDKPKAERFHQLISAGSKVEQGGMADSKGRLL